MIKEISGQIYNTLKNDATLISLLPNVKDGSNIWEMRMPQPTTAAKFPIVVFRVISGSPLLEVKALRALNWFVEIDIIGKDASMATLWDIYHRIYQLLQDANMSSSTKKALKCSLDFVNTDYDSNTFVSFILTRWQIWSMELPHTTLGELT